MKKLSLLIITGVGLWAVTDALAQQTGYGVGINTPLSNTNSVDNPKQNPLIVVAFCNATASSKDIEGWVGQNSPTTLQDMIASESGTDRLSITFVVPWRWYYQIKVADSNGLMPPGIFCKATAWWTY